jgi:hypothetical protein
MFTTLASTGELLHLSPPKGLQNASYNIESIVPIVRCFPSNDSVRTWTATAAYQNALADSQVVDFVPHAQNLTYTAKDGVSGKIGYFGMLGNTSITPNQAGILADVWIAMATPLNGTSEIDLASDVAAPYSASYYTCTLRNASVNVSITFINNVQSLQTGAVRELDFNLSKVSDGIGDDTDHVYALENYGNFGYLLYSYLVGVVFIENNQYENYSSGAFWNTTIDQTILGTAMDFSAMMAAWKYDGLEPGAIAQNRNLTSLIEEFSLNASLSLMSRSAFR